MSDAPGWYSDPSDARQGRYWDGQNWTPNTTPIPPGESLPRRGGGPAGAMPFEQVGQHSYALPELSGAGRALQESRRKTRRNLGIVFLVVLIVAAAVGVNYLVHRGDKAGRAISMDGGTYHQFMIVRGCLTPKQGPKRIEDCQPGLEYLFSVYRLDGVRYQGASFAPTLIGDTLDYGAQAETITVKDSDWDIQDGSVLRPQGTNVSVPDCDVRLHAEGGASYVGSYGGACHVVTHAPMEGATFNEVAASTNMTTLADHPALLARVLREQHDMLAKVTGGDQTVCLTTQITSGLGPGQFPLLTDDNGKAIVPFGRLASVDAYTPAFAAALTTCGMTPAKAAGPAEGLATTMVSDLLNGGG